MTLDLLVLIFQNKRLQGLNTRESMVAVVKALQNEFREEYGLWERFDKILGEPEGKAAGASCRKDEVGGVEQAYPAVTPAAAHCSVVDDTGGAFTGLMDGLAKAVTPAAPIAREDQVRGGSAMKLTPEGLKYLRDHYKDGFGPVTFLELLNHIAAIEAERDALARIVARYESDPPMSGRKQEELK